MKKLLIVANWKMNPERLTQAKLLFNSVKQGIKKIRNTHPNRNQRFSNRVEVVICPPFVYLSALKANGAQDCFWENKGAYTGEISPLMLKDIGVKYVLIGHSERRARGETFEMINKKIKAVLKVGLKPILCIDKLSQIPKDIQGNYILAYEPVFAIGTGKPCSVERSKKMRKNADNNFVLYGGSVNSQNAKDYIEKAGFQGLLIGGASLNSKEFLRIIKNVAI